LINKIVYPFKTFDSEKFYDIFIKTRGGGLQAQVDAILFGVSKALSIVQPKIKKNLKQKGFFTRDVRIKERKKYGLKKARKASQFSKR
tara:strand:+ start:782 stop:1045 length:264 start_codon:yes stop_codon:yes gene_type:complete